MKVNVKEFLEKYRSDEYRHGIFIPEDIMMKCSQMELAAILNNKSAGEIEVPDDTFEQIELARCKSEKRDSDYHEISLHRVTGMDLEKKGEIDDAIVEYAESIKLGEDSEFDMFHAYAHSYHRIIVLLDKVKRYAAEIDYIEKYLEHITNEDERDRYNKRISKTRVKLSKQTANGK